MDRGKVKLSFLWHLHQPPYIVNNEAFLPYAYLRTLKDYYFMIKLALKKEIKVNFNLTMSLLEQLLAYSEGNVKDPYIEVMKKPPNLMSYDEKELIKKNFFDIPKNIYGDKLPFVKRIDELKDKKIFTEQDFRDIQVIFHLSWLYGSFQIVEGERFKELYNKERNFSESDKSFLLSIESNVLKETLKLYKEAFLEGRIELWTSPFYHPITPLLIDIKSAREADEGIQLPNISVDMREDAEGQIKSAFEYFENYFGKPPDGIWFPESASSFESLEMASKFAKYTILDESFLSRLLKTRDSQGPTPELYKIYSVGKMKVAFRDNVISDLIGFTYWRWSTRDAVDDFVSKMLKIKNLLTDTQKVITVALDGENPWDFYKHNGFDFLSEIYSFVSEEFETSLFKDVFSKTEIKDALERIKAGTWAMGSFSTWIGHPSKNKAWEYIARVLSERKGKKRKYLWMAESSDWFWWFGTQEENKFEPLLRRFLQLACGDEYPDFLNISIDSRALAPKRIPFGFLSPVIDGKETDYFEWLPAGYIDISDFSSTQISSSKLIKSLYFGFDTENLYLRVDTSVPISKIVENNKLKIGVCNGDVCVYLILPDDGKSKLEFSYDEVLEIKIPLKEISATYESNIDIFISIEDDGKTVEKFPDHGNFSVRLSKDEIDNAWVL